MNSDRSWISMVPSSSRVSEQDVIVASLKAKAHELSLELIAARAENAVLRSAIASMIDEL